MAYEEEKTYTIEGKTLDEIKDKLYSKYGSDYRIIKRSTDFRPAGFLRLSQKEIQVVKYKINHKTYENDNDNVGKQFYPSVFSEGLPQKNTNNTSTFEENRKALLEILSKQNNSSNNDMLNKINSKIDEMNKQIASMQNSFDTSNSAMQNHPTITKIEELLSENEFTLSYIKMIIDKIKQTFPLEQLDDFKLVQRSVVQWIGETISIAKEKAFRPPHVIVIVGPTGVGKTTTVAKMASKSILDAKEKNLIRPEMCIVTVDTMRVGAMEQLSRFGDLLGKNVVKAETAEDLKVIYNEYKDHVDYIFIDTSGYSPTDTTNISTMLERLNVNMNSDVYLAISASTKASDIITILRNYEPFAYESVIITKCDETKSYGNIISVLWEKHKSISFITNGQKVPKDICRGNVIEMLKNLKGFDIDRVHIENLFGEK